MAAGDGSRAGGRQLSQRTWQMFEEVSKVAARVQREAREGLERLGAAGEEDAAVNARGVALTSFGLEDMRRLQVQALPEECVREALATWGPVEFSTAPAEGGGFRSSARVPGLPRGWHERRWHGEVSPDAPSAELSAASAALAAVLAAPELGCCGGGAGEGGGGAGEAASTASVRAGEALEIVGRSRDGWVCCRSAPDAAPVWLPTANVAELATVAADHCVDSEQEALNVKTGDVVEIVSRHYSGWFLCRPWLGIEHAAEDRKEGWVCSTYLEESGGSAAELRGLVAEALESVAEEAGKLEEIVAAAQGEAAGQGEAIDRWLDLGLQRVVSLAEELESIKQAAADKHGEDVKPGTLAAANDDVIAGEEHELSLVQGDKVVILHVHASGWMWCRMADGDGDEDVVLDGWVPRHALDILRVDGCYESDPTPPASMRSAPPTQRSSAGPPTMRSGAPLPTIRSTCSSLGPVCAICLEPLGGSGHALQCAHTFHQECLNPWLAEKAECPLCRAPTSSPAAEVIDGVWSPEEQPDRWRWEESRSEVPGMSTGRRDVVRGGVRTRGSSILRSVFAGMSAQVTAGGS